MHEAFERIDKRMPATNTLEPHSSEPATDLVNEQQAVSKRRRRTWAGFFRDICVYIMAYVVVSGVLIGPMFWTWYGAVYVDGPKWIAKFFLPLAVLCEIFPPLSWLVNAWVNWWIL
jgi:hypothetical protein